MRATRAYIASAGTAAVMLGASFAMFILMSAFVAFGSWPGAKSGTQVSNLVLSRLAQTHARNVAVRSNAVALARRAARQSHPVTGSAPTRSATTPSGTAVAATPTPTATTRHQPATGSPLAVAPTTQQTTQAVSRTVQNTTTQVTTQVQQQAQNVQTQVNQVVDQVVGGAQTTADSTTQTVTNAAGSLLGP